MGLLQPHDRRRRPGGPAGLRRAVVVRDLAGARAAARAAQACGRRLAIAAPADAACHAGPLWWKTLVDLLQREFPDLDIAAELDCGAEAGTAVAALRLGIKHLRFSGNAAAAKRLAALAAGLGARVAMGPAGERLDLAQTADPETACRTFFAGKPA